MWPITPPEPTTYTLDTPEGPATVTVRYEWDLRTQINTMRRTWVFASGERAEDEIRRRALFPREVERYAMAAGFELLDMTDGTGPELTGPVAYTVARYTR
ncbi:hypothetical protein ABZX85_42000 [Streptomyces sp. NPDC004539]|uniref:hypothetical protein n=1 Tax=Streptomyces sp. NPDC004539 TaxID=3154280 RepID=UPI0033AB6083